MSMIWKYGLFNVNKYTRLVSLNSVWMFTCVKYLIHSQDSDNPKIITWYRLPDMFRYFNILRALLNSNTSRWNILTRLHSNIHSFLSFKWCPKRTYLFHLISIPVWNRIAQKIDTALCPLLKSPSIWLIRPHFTEQDHSISIHSYFAWRVLQHAKSGRFHKSSNSLERAYRFLFIKRALLIFLCHFDSCSTRVTPRQTLSRLIAPPERLRISREINPGSFMWLSIAGALNSVLYELRLALWWYAVVVLGDFDVLHQCRFDI